MFLSKETREAREGRISVGCTGIWVNTGTDWHDRPGILLGDQACWNKLSLDDAEELAKALIAKIYEVRRNDTIPNQLEINNG
jgi:hypothetical protein